MAALAMVAVRPARTSNLMFNHSWQQNADSETTMESSLTFILLGSIFGTVLVPVLAALFFFSTWILRPRLVFRLNVAALILGIAQSAILIALYVRVSCRSHKSILQPLN
jgi:multisubunit Na+/H+ antiporter MnhE subunit